MPSTITNFPIDYSFTTILPQIAQALESPVKILDSKFVLIRRANELVFGSPSIGDHPKDKGTAGTPHTVGIIYISFKHPRTTPPSFIKLIKDFKFFPQDQDDAAVSILFDSTGDISDELSLLLHYGTESTFPYNVRLVAFNRHIKVKILFFRYDPEVIQPSYLAKEQLNKLKDNFDIDWLTFASDDESTLLKNLAPNFPVPPVETLRVLTYDYAVDWSTKVDTFQRDLVRDSRTIPLVWTFDPGFKLRIEEPQETGYKRFVYDSHITPIYFPTTFKNALYQGTRRSTELGDSSGIVRKLISSRIFKAYRLTITVYPSGRKLIVEDASHSLCNILSGHYTFPKCVMKHRPLMSLEFMFRALHLTVKEGEFHKLHGDQYTVNFHIDRSSSKSIGGVDFAAPPFHIAIVGPKGSGKSFMEDILKSFPGISTWDSDQYQAEKDIFKRIMDVVSHSPQAAVKLFRDEVSANVDLIKRYYHESLKPDTIISIGLLQSEEEANAIGLSTIRINNRVDTNLSILTRNRYGRPNDEMGLNAVMISASNTSVGYRPWVIIESLGAIYGDMGKKFVERAYQALFNTMFLDMGTEKTMTKINMMQESPEYLELHKKFSIQNLKRLSADPMTGEVPLVYAFSASPAETKLSLKSDITAAVKDLIDPVMEAGVDVPESTPKRKRGERFPTSNNE